MVTFWRDGGGEGKLRTKQPLPCRTRKIWFVMNGPFLVVNSPQIVCVSEPDNGITQVTVRGRWNGALREEASRVLRACVTQAPRMLLVDLTQLQDPAGDSATMWRTAARYARTVDPPVILVVCAAVLAVRQRLSADGDQTVMLADTVDAALAATPSQNGWIAQHHLALPAVPGAGALARTMVGDACLAFDVAHLVHPARLIVSELVSNAVLHAGTDMDVWVSVRDVRLHLAVQDRSRDLPQLRDTGTPPAALQRGWGLGLVAAAAATWGAMPSRHGKVVWANLDTQAETAS
ncbi:ATP-binding protein [Actinoplanes sp. NPDC051346]|uniref:ATP-binding protein n=1 Tax=Actinoplanes sp. NPDC051346 TaxID=3155048 RepID=UPI003444EB03